INSSTLTVPPFATLPTPFFPRSTSISSSALSLGSFKSSSSSALSSLSSEPLFLVPAMEIIEEVEPNKRGVYGGSVGYFGFSGNMDMCITIRTVFINDARIYVQAGAGIVADSDPRKEYEETVNKARGMLEAVDMAREAETFF